MATQAAESFVVKVPDSDLADLRDRLLRARWADDFANDDWRYGVERSWLEGMVRYWLEDYDWRAQEARINSWSHYKVELDGVPVHFARLPGKGPDPMPIVLTHGWPWTFWDMRDMAEMLADPAAHGGDPADSFEVIVPSLPGFGFSTPLRRGGVDVAGIAERWVELMTGVLGFERFGAFGGDWGAMVTGHIGHLNPPGLAGVMMSMLTLPGVNRRDIGPEAWSDEDRWMIDRQAEAEKWIRSHVAVHVSDPQTLAYGLADSPLGTAAWLWERRRNWSDCNGDVLSVFSADDLITHASIYWLNGSITTSLRLYAEHFSKPWPLAPGRGPGISAPTSFAVFPRDLVFLPRSVVEANCDLRQWTVMPAGGHFGPAEQPGPLAGEIRRFFRPLR